MGEDCGHGESAEKPVGYRWRYPEGSWIMTDVPPEEGGYGEFEHEALYVTLPARLAETGDVAAEIAAFYADRLDATATTTLHTAAAAAIRSLLLDRAPVPGGVDVPEASPGPRR